MNWKNIGLKNIFIIYTVIVLIIGFGIGNMIGKYQGAKELAEILKEKAITLDGKMKNSDFFTLGDSKIYYISETTILPEELFNVTIQDLN